MSFINCTFCWRSAACCRELNLSDRVFVYAVIHSSNISHIILFIHGAGRGGRFSKVTSPERGLETQFLSREASFVI